MNIFEDIQNKIADIEKFRQTVINWPQDVDINFVSSNNVFMHNCEFKNVSPTLHKLRKALGNYKLGSYYYSSGRLALSYEFKGLHVVFFVEPEALNEVSQGKCSYTRREQLTTEITCNL